MALAIPSTSLSKETPLMSIAMSLSHVKTTTTKQLQPSSDEEDVTEFSFKRSITYENGGDNRVSHYVKNWERKEKKVNEANRSSAARIRQSALDLEKLLDNLQQHLNQQEKSNIGFDLLSAESKWTEIVEKEEKVPKAKAVDEEEEAGSWTVTAKKSIEYSRG